MRSLMKWLIMAMHKRSRLKISAKILSMRQWSSSNRARKKSQNRAGNLNFSNQALSHLQLFKNRYQSSTTKRKSSPMKSLWIFLKSLLCCSMLMGWWSMLPLMESFKWRAILLEILNWDWCWITTCKLANPQGKLGVLSLMTVTSMSVWMSVILKQWRLWPSIHQMENSWSWTIVSMENTLHLSESTPSSTKYLSISLPSLSK